MLTVLGLPAVTGVDAYLITRPLPSRPVLGFAYVPSSSGYGLLVGGSF
jgi:hypothetical protein